MPWSMRGRPTTSAAPLAWRNFAPTLRAIWDHARILEQARKSSASAAASVRPYPHRRHILLGWGRRPPRRRSMCAEVRVIVPGACPRCGMALEREMPLAASHVEYTCPMHPEMVRPGPGSCPICGMALEPRMVAAQEEDNPELRDMTRRFWISLALTAPLFAVAITDMLPA